MKIYEEIHVPTLKKPLRRCLLPTLPNTYQYYMRAPLYFEFIETTANPSPKFMGCVSAVRLLHFETRPYHDILLPQQNNSWTTSMIFPVLKASACFMFIGFCFTIYSIYSQPALFGEF